MIELCVRLEIVYFVRSYIVCFLEPTLLNECSMFLYLQLSLMSSKEQGKGDQVTIVNGARKVHLNLSLNGKTISYNTLLYEVTVYH